jgi:hypothetical protein
MRKPVAREFEDDLIDDMLDYVYEALIDGARGSGTTLTKGECALLLKQLPPLVSWGSARWKEIALHSYFHGTAKTMRAFGISRALVFEARRRMAEYKAHGQAVTESN